MKDKLYKNNHRGTYYRVKAFFFVFVLFASMMAVAMIPTYIVIRESVKEATKAEPEVVEVDDHDLTKNSDDDDDSRFTLMHY